MATNGRLRDYLTKNEVRALLRAAKRTRRYGARNYAMILLAYRHGFRASELVELRVCDIDSCAATVHCRRRKGSNSSVHPMKRDELEAIERVLRDRDLDPRDHLFRSERGERLTRYAFWRIVSEAGKRAGLPMKTYAHQLRHACGYALANKGCDLRLIQDYPRAPADPEYGPLYRVECEKGSRGFGENHYPHEMQLHDPLVRRANPRAQVIEVTQSGEGRPLRSLQDCVPPRWTDSGKTPASVLLQALRKRDNSFAQAVRYI